MQFSLIFFSGDERRKYRVLLEAAKIADERRFAAIWTPERHFHRFGGLYPNPSVLAAALAMVTRRIDIRAGSVILPLHHPIRVAEEWSVVDNLSGGRVGLAGHRLQPRGRAEAQDCNWPAQTFEAVETIRSLWEGNPAFGARRRR